MIENKDGVLQERGNINTNSLNLFHTLFHTVGYQKFFCDFLIVGFNYKQQVDGPIKKQKEIEGEVLKINPLRL